MSSLVSATIGQLLRSGQRDEQYLKELNNELNQIIQYWFGIRRWLYLRDNLASTCISQLIYYSMTTLSALQTLGEEYVNIVQIDGNKVIVPKLFKRFVATILQIFTPYLLSTLLRSLSRRLEDEEKDLPSIVENSPQQRERLLKIVSIIETLFQFIHKIHLILFYLNGNYYHFSKRVTNIRYLSLNRSLTEGSTNSSHYIYKILGYLSLSQICISLLVRLKAIQNSIFSSNENELMTKRNETFIKSNEVEITHRCSLCLEKRENSCVTPCGHLFCWFCILEWLQMKNECPLCREALQSCRVVPLKNYP